MQYKLNEEDEEDPFEVVNDEDIEIVDDMVATAVNNFVGFVKCPIEHMQCAEHTLQLAIQDGLNGNHAANAIVRYRKLVISARAPIVDAIISKKSWKRRNSQPSNLVGKDV